MGEVNKLFNLLNTFHFSEGEKAFFELRNSLIDGVFFKGNKFEITQKVKEKKFNKFMVLNLNSDEDMSVHLLYTSFDYPILFLDEIIKIKVTKETGERIIEKRVFVRDLIYSSGNKMHFMINLNEVLLEVIKFVDETCKVAVVLESKKDEFDSSKMHELIIDRFYETFSLNFAKAEYSKFFADIRSKFDIDLNLPSKNNFSYALKSLLTPKDAVKAYKFLLEKHRPTITISFILENIANFQQTNDLFYLLQISSILMPNISSELL